MTTNGNIIVWCNSTQQGAPHTGKQMCACASDFGSEQSRYLLSRLLLYRHIWMLIMHLGQRQVDGPDFSSRSKAEATAACFSVMLIN